MIREQILVPEIPGPFPKTSRVATYKPLLCDSGLAKLKMVPDDQCRLSIFNPFRERTRH